MIPSRGRWIRLWLLALPAGFVVGCALPPGAEMASVAGGGGSRSAPAVIQHDIRALLADKAREPEPLAFEGVLTLEVLLDEVLARNPSLEARRHAWLAAEARAPQVSALEDPQFSFMFAPRLIDRVGQGSETGPMGETEELGFAYKPEISQAIPWPGKRALRAEAADHGADAEFHDAVEIRERLLNETKDAFYELFFADRALEINTVNLQILDDLVANARSRYEAGTTHLQEALQAELDRERLHHREVELRRMNGVARARINTLLNRSPAAELPPPPVSLPVPGAERDRAALQRASLNDRPELQAAAARLEAARTEVQRARKEFYPDFMVSAAFDAFWQETDLRPMLGFGLNIPIQQGRRRAALREAEERLAAAGAELERVAAGVALEVEVALQRLTESVHGSDLYRDRLLPVARENVESALAGYESGALDMSAVLMAQKALMDMQLAAIGLQVDARRRLAELERAVGRSLAPLAEDRIEGETPREAGP